MASIPALEAADPVAEDGEVAEDAAQDDETGKQIRVDGWKKFTTIKQIKDLLQKQGVRGVRKVKKQQESFAFLYFHSVEERNAAETALQGLRWKGCELWVRPARPLDPERFAKKQERTEEAGPSSEAAAGEPSAKRPVSYTHLTLPTKRIV